MMLNEFQQFHDREDAARQLADKLKGRELHNPLVLAIPRGGVVTGAVLARELGAELDVVLSRKLRAPMQEELAVGAVSEDGRVFFNPGVRAYVNVPDEYLEDEKRHQLAEIARRKRLIRRVKPQAAVGGRSVIVTDDGIATGATMIAALQTVRQAGPRELIAAAPVVSPDRLAEVGRWCDDAVCLVCSEPFWAIGQFYEHFEPVEDEEMLRRLQLPATAEATKAHAGA